MSIYATKWFCRWQKEKGIADAALCGAISEMRSGLFEADLGGGLYKKRVARPGQGKSGGFRTLIATCKDSRWIFLYGFAKNERGNVDKDEERALKTLAAHLLGLSSIELAVATRAGELLEVSVDAKK